MKIKNLSKIHKVVLLLVHFMGFHHKAAGDLTRNLLMNEDGENHTWKKLDLSPVPLYFGDRFEMDQANCRRQAKCVKLQNTTCMGTQLPYDMTTLDLIPEHVTQDSIQERLRLLHALRHIPKCWAVVQPFLCSLFMPKCVNVDTGNDTIVGQVDLPTHDMCKLILGPCRILFNQPIWPSFIKCDNTELFPKMCKNDIRELKFNTSGRCLRPLVPTDNSLAIFEGVEGCGTQCSDPMFTPDEQKQIHSFIAWGAGICGSFNLFTVVTFLIDWRSANKYPALIIFYINCCFLVSCIGWLAQFGSGNRELIVCRKDGTPRIAEPSGETLSCVVVFILIYYSLMAATVWFTILTYAWHMSFQALEKIKDRIDKKAAYFHLIAWCLPLVLTVTIIAMGEIDGNSVTGICFVGYANHVVRAWFLLGPIFVGVLVGGYFLSRGLITLIHLKISSQNIISKRVSAKLRKTIVRMVFFSVFTFLAVVVTFYCHIYEFQNSWKWSQSFRKYMICAITSKYMDEYECKMEHKPSLAKLQLHLLAPFFTGISMSSWVWTCSTLNTWTRFFRRTFNKETEEPVQLEKHKVIAQAYAKRKTYYSAGRVSLSIHHTHEDPVGLISNLNSVASLGLTPEFAAFLPKLFERRGALVGGNTGSDSSNCRNSVDSEISISVRQVSVESRRNSVDSQISVQIAELKTTRKIASSSGPRRKHRKRRRDYGNSRSTRVGPLIRRGSTTSQESQQILSVLNIGGTPNVPQVPNMKRRSATAGLDDRSLNSKLIMDGKNAGMLLPLLLRNQSASDENFSDEEKGHGTIAHENGDGEAGNPQKDEHDSDSEDSQPDEETKMLEPEELPERSKSKSSNKSYGNESGRRSREGRKSKYSIQDETVSKHFLQQESNLKFKIENENYNKAAIGDWIMLSDSQTNQTNAVNSINAREMATQTSLPLDILEMEEVDKSIYEIINSRGCSSKGTQILSQLNNGNRKVDVKNMGTSPVFVPRPSKEGRKNERRNSQNKNG